MTKNLGKKIIIGSLIIGGLAGILGSGGCCSTEESKLNQEEYIQVDNKARYFTDKGIIAPLERHGSEDGIAMTLEDMDGDKDLDILIGKSSWNNSGVRYFENNLPQKNR